MGTIAFTKVKLPYGFLSNMSPHPVVRHNVQWRTAEAALQAGRFDGSVDQDVRDAIFQAKSPMAAKLIAKANAKKMVRIPRSPEDVSAAWNILHAKLEQHLDLARPLALTGDDCIIEDCSKRCASESSLFWGASVRPSPGAPEFTVGGIAGVGGVRWYGLNVLGRLWMDLRHSLLFGNSDDDYMFELLMGYPRHECDLQYFTVDGHVRTHHGDQVNEINFDYSVGSFDPVRCVFQFIPSSEQPYNEPYNGPGCQWVHSAKELAKLLYLFCSDTSGINPFL
jgi:predicted NAD-dependent protein-ADP-ribosyltransferase YbiA (DUF1768 family)